MRKFDAGRGGMLSELEYPGTREPETRELVTSPVLDKLQDLLTELRPIDSGEVATYIPELGRADPEWFGISVVTSDGHVFEVGDSRQEFTIQSISKPFVFGMALEERGREAVMGHVGVEPSGNAFNAIVVDDTNRPFNPMVNAGAIVTTGLIARTDPSHALDRVVDVFSAFAGRRLSVDESVYASESATGDRNRALGFLMKSFGVLDGDVETAVDLYFKQCSLLVTARDLAVMAATLANRGVNPITGTRAIDEEYVENVLSVMSTCGMYDYAGEWGYRVGLPAKSGVAGGVVAVLPGQFGIGVFSPPLDVKGNSVRGVEVCRRLATDFALHPLRYQPRVAAAVRRTTRGHEARSNRVRPPAAHDYLSAHASCIVVYELEGDLYFGSTERVFRRIAADLDDVRFVILDCKRVTSVDAAALSMLLALEAELRAVGRSLALAYVRPESLVYDQLADLHERGVPAFPDTDEALEAFEEMLLEEADAAGAPPAPVVASQELLAGLSAGELEAVQRVAELQPVSRGQAVFRTGDVADAMYFVLAGSVSVRVPLGSGRSHRLSTLGAGVAFGEMAILDAQPRSADIVADEDGALARLSVDDLQALAVEHPNLAATLYRNLSVALSRRLRSANEQVRALEQ
jgi:glutaminase